MTSWGFFDWDGTVADTENIVLESLIARFNELYAAEAGRELTLPLFLETSHGLAREVLCARLSEVFGITVDYEKLYDRREERMGEILRRTDVVFSPGIVPAMQAIQARGVRFAIVTNNPLRRAHIIMESDKGGEGAELKKLFEREFDTLQRRMKPHPDVYNFAIESVGADPAKSFAVEDSVTGMKAARAAEVGGKKLGLLVGYTGFSPEPEKLAAKLTGAGADVVTADMAELPGIITQRLN